LEDRRKNNGSVTTYGDCHVKCNINTTIDIDINIVPAIIMPCVHGTIGQSIEITATSTGVIRSAVIGGTAAHAVKLIIDIGC